jgi:acyl carrier protein
MGKQLSLKELRDAILSTASARPGNSIPDDVDLFDEGYLDSFSVLQLIQVLEEKLDIVFDHRDLRRE